MHLQGRPGMDTAGRTRKLALLLCSALGAVSVLTVPGAATAQARDDGAVSELVVTAQRREESLLEVPLSVAVVSGQTLEDANFASLTDITNLAVGVSYNTNFGGGFQIRGVGTQSVTSTGEQSVSIVVDDVVQGLPEISFAGPSYQALTDIQRVEVLRGPQGTLFGKNSSAGVLQIVTVKPALGEYLGDASVSYGTDNELRMTANLNVPIGDTAALRLSGFGYRRDGYIDNRFTGLKVGGYENFGIRGKLLWKPSESTEIYLIGAHIENQDTGNGIWTLRTCGSGNTAPQGRFVACDEVAKLGVTAGPKNLAGAWDGKLGVKAVNDSISGRFTWDIAENVTLKAITAYYEVDINEDVEVDSSQRPIISVNHSDFDEKQFTQEIRLEGEFGNIEYTVGGFYYDADIVYSGLQAGTFNFLTDSSPVLLTSGVGGPVPCCTSVMDSNTESLAAFGQVTARFLDDRLSITAGLRYTDDKVTLKNHAEDVVGICQFAFALGGACKPAVGLPSPILTLTKKADDTSGRVSVQYEVVENVNVYATYSTGYKGPLVSYPRGQPLVAVDPETVENYEVGIKGAFIDNRLVATLSVFKSDFTNFQGQTLRVDPANPASRSLVTTNAGGLKTKGFEAEASFQITPELSVRGAYAYTPTEFVDFAIPCNDRFANPSTVPGQCTFISQQAPGVLQFNAGGYPLPYSPKNSFNLGLDYQRELSNDMRFGLSLNYNWRSRTYTTVADPGSITPSYGLLGANVSYGPTDGRWRASLFARNLLDEYFVSGIFRTPLDTGAAGTTPLSVIGYANIPSIESSRTVGVKLEMSF